MASPRIHEDEFEALEVIGRGSFGQIRKVRRVADGHILARKEISYQTMTPKEKSQLIAEFRILKSLEHPNIVQYYHHDHIAEDHTVHLYMEYCGGGDLSHIIKQCQAANTLVPENIIWSVFTQLVLALFRCHYNTDPPPPDDPFLDTDCTALPPTPDSFVLHRDIKPDNVFLDENYSVRLGDFGLAKMLDQDNNLARTYVGTPYYMSPEVLTDQPSTPHSDIWSLGCVMYELCALHPPFQAKTHLLLSQKIRDGVYPPIPACYSSTLFKTISACLTLTPSHRPTTTSLLRLDVIKLCRRERAVLDREAALQAAEDHLHMQRSMLAEQHAQALQEIEAQRHQIEMDVYNKLEREIEAEVDKRVARVLREHNIKLASEIESNIGGATIERSSSVSSAGSFSTALASSLSAAAPWSPKPRLITNTDYFGKPGFNTKQQPPRSPVSASTPDPTQYYMNKPPSPSPSLNRGNMGVRGPRSQRERTGTTLANSSGSNTSIMTGYATPIAPLRRYDSENVDNSQNTSNQYNRQPHGYQTRQPSELENQNPTSWVSPVPNDRPWGMGLGATAGKSQGMESTAETPTSQPGEETAWGSSVYGDSINSPFLKRWERRSVS